MFMHMQDREITELKTKICDLETLQKEFDKDLKQERRSLVNVIGHSWGVNNSSTTCLFVLVVSIFAYMCLSQIEGSIVSRSWNVPRSDRRS